MFVLVLFLAILLYQILGRYQKLPSFLQDLYERLNEKQSIQDDVVIINQMEPWKRGTKRNFAEVHIYLAGWLMQLNRSESKAKIQYIHSYLARFFRGEGVFSEEMSAALRYETDIKSMCNWLNSRVKYREQKSSLLNFLIALALIDGEVVKNEFDALVKLGVLLGFEQLVIEEMINQQSSARRKREQSTQEAYVPRETLRSQSLKILEISAGADSEEIKIAYRNLAKQYHPDKHHSASLQDQENASQKFREIQQAYDYLMQNS